jgi:hypothetical protein
MGSSRVVGCAARAVLTHLGIQKMRQTHPERVGVLLVHGIGEQRRFEHLDSQLRDLLRAIRATGTATVEVLAGDAATFQAEQDTWRAGRYPPVRVVVAGNGTGKETHLFFHEVWWGDINEPYTLEKQFRFWLWGLSIWAQPRDRASCLPGAQELRLPSFPGKSLGRLELWVRLRLLMVANVFLMAASSIGALVFVLQRLLNVAPPNIIRVFVNYISGVKLYVQRARAGGAPLEGIDEPPRVAIRRRMIRALADMFAARYDRWYVLGHSLGSVVAHNGLMETATALPNYLDERRWLRLVRAGAAGPGAGSAPATMLPARPLWLEPQDVVHRNVLFKNFAGFLSYGSPLDKFAAIWRARVPINESPDFPPNAQWINVFDGTDPVGGRLDAYGDPGIAVPGTLAPVNMGYKASSWLLRGHVLYLARSRRLGDAPANTLVDRIVNWIIHGTPFVTATDAAGWYPAAGPTVRRRQRSAFVQWVLVYAVLTLVAAVTAPIIWEAVVGFVTSAGAVIARSAAPVQ